jgi:hypothetical protein
MVPATKSESFDLVPPHAAKVKLNVTEAARKENDRRLALEDSIRNATMKSFKDSVWIAEFAAKTKLPVHVAEDPLRAVVRGTGIALKNIGKFKFLMTS